MLLHAIPPMSMPSGQNATAANSARRNNYSPRLRGNTRADRTLRRPAGDWKALVSACSLKRRPRPWALEIEMWNARAAEGFISAGRRRAGAKRSFPPGPWNAAPPARERLRIMSAIGAVWTDGQIVPSEPVDMAGIRNSLQNAALSLKSRRVGESKSLTTTTRFLRTGFNPC